MNNSKNEQLYWHCLKCGAHDPVKIASDKDQPVLLDYMPCTTCNNGMVYAVTIRLGAAYEQGLALGLSVEEAWSRAKDKVLRA
jgi:hypothetical protein